MILSLISSCSSKATSEASSKKEKLAKSLSILTLTPRINLINDAGDIYIDTTTGAKENQLSYEKKQWRQWCVLHDREEKGERIIEVQNSSFTGSDGCKLIWHLSLTKDSELKIKQKTGTITGKGKIFSLDINLDVGKIFWKKSDMPIHIKVEKGAVLWEADAWPMNQKSTISVASGSVVVESPKNASVTTHISNLEGSHNDKNDFSAQDTRYHQLLIEMAAGKVLHKRKVE